MKTFRLFTFALLACLPLLRAEEAPTPISFDQLGAQAQKQYTGDGIGITPTAGGARLRAIMQQLEGEATTEGLWLRSTAEEDTGLENRFRVRAMAFGRTSAMNALSSTGPVHAASDTVAWLRPGLTEEYSVSSDGVQQDFVVATRPLGAGELTVELEVAGAWAQVATHGATLTLDATGRELAYHRLKVNDATGRELTARLEVLATNRLRVVVEDAGAVYPVRIDPTFSDVDWVSLNSGMPGANQAVTAMVTDGSGNLYIGGFFTFVGSTFANRVAKWNGSTWSALGVGVNDGVYSLAINGSSLYVGGLFTMAGGTPAHRIAKWDGTAWSALGPGLDNRVHALAVIGGDLYAGGFFTTTQGGPANAFPSIAKWNGSAWSSLGTGMDDGAVLALAVMGSDLYAGGNFFTAGGVFIGQGLAKWNGSEWSAVDSNFFNFVNALAVSGSNLYVGGSFNMAGDTPAESIAKWDGTAWSALGAGIQNFTVNTLVVNGSDVYAGGNFSTAGGAPASNIAKWNGSTWSTFSTGLNFGVNALAVVGSDVYAGGGFSTAGGTTANCIAKWNGSAWSATSGGIDSQVNALAVNGSDLYIGGAFSIAGNTPANRIAKWNGSTWSALGSGINNAVNVLAVRGSDVYAAGNFNTAGGTPASNIAKWNGTTWSAVGGGTNQPIAALVFSGSDLYVGGTFTLAGSTPVSRIAKWDGSTWSALGTGMNDSVLALEVSGSILYAAGAFTTANGASANRIAKWDGSAWSALGSGLNNRAFALAVSGSNVYVAGQFTMAGVVSATRIARWDGSAWSALGSGLNNTVQALAVVGNDLYAGGQFTTAGGTSASLIAKWDGSVWSALGSGIGGTGGSYVSTLAAGPSSLYVAGFFATAGTTLSPFVAQANVAPTVITPTSASVTHVTATLGGNVTSDGGVTITERGVVYALTSVEPNPTLATGTKATAGGTTGVFTVDVTDLTAGSGYTFKAFATNAVGTTYTSVSTFTTLAAPTVSAPTIPDVTAFTATLGGTVDSDGGAGITERGVVYAKTSENADPTLATGTRATTSGTTGAFTVDVSGLSAHTSYTFKAYAINSAGTSYSNAETFTTLNTAPTAPDGSFTGTTGDQKTITLPFPTTDADGDAVTIFTIMNVTPGLGVSAITDTTVTFTPNAHFTGNGTFTYIVRDGFSFTSGTITVTVTDNDGPVLWYVSLTSNNPLYTDRASLGHVLTLDFNADEAVTVEEVLFRGAAVTPVDLGGNTYRVQQTVTAGSPQGDVTFRITARDQFGNLTVRTTTTDGSSMLVDSIAPILDPVTLASNNAHPAFAKDGDVITVRFTTQEPTNQPLVYLMGQYAPPVNVGGNSWQASAAVDVFTSEGPVTFSIDVTDPTLNRTTQTTTTDGSSVTVDRGGPGFTPVTLVSNNADPAIAEVGDTITLSFTTTEPTTTPIVTLLGATVVPASTGGDSWQAQVTVTSNTPTGAVTFSITATDAAGNPSTQTTTTDGSAVTVEAAPADLTLVDDTVYGTTGMLTINVLANDTAATGTLALTAITQPSRGKTKIVAGKVQFTPSATITAPITFTYTATNGSITATATVTVRPLSVGTGTFVGLLRRASDNSVRGRVVMTVSAKGALTGGLRYEGRTFTLKGSLNGVGVSGTGIIPRPLLLNTTGLDADDRPILSLSIPDLSNPGTHFTGTAERSPYSASNPTPDAGTYTMLAELPSGGTGPALGAAMRCKITADGTVTFGGKLGNNVAVTQGGRLLRDGRLPFFVSQGTQRIGGELDFTKTTVNQAIDGVLRWSVPNGADPRLSGGLEQDYDAFGLSFTPGLNAAAMFSPPAPSATLTLTVPSVSPTPVVRPLTLTGAAPKGTQKIAAPGQGATVLTFTTNNGIFTGTRTIPGNIKRSFFGVILQGAGINQGRGVLVEPITLSPVTIVP